MALNQPSEPGSWNCEGLVMETDVGSIPLPPCCRADTLTCGVDISVAKLGEELGFPLTEGAEFGCVDPLPFVENANVETLPEFWKDGDNAVTAAPACEPR